MDSPQKLATQSTQDKEKQNKNTTCVGHHYYQLDLKNILFYIITGDLKIINNTSLRDVFAKGPKYREPKSIHWKHKFKILMDSVEDYATQ